MRKTVYLKINGVKSPFEVEPDERLVDTLREKAGLTGTKEGCRIGECGACSVIMDGKLVAACLVLTVAVEGSEITTVEGLSQGGELCDLQQAFIEEDAVQCGYCTPGMLMAANYLLSRYRRPTTEQIRSGLCGNICRCTGYVKIVSAVRKTAFRRANQQDRR